MNNALPDKDKKPLVLSSRGLALILIASLTFFIAVSLAWNIIQQRKDTLELARVHAETTLGKDILYRRWIASIGGVYAPVSDEIQPNPYLEGVVSERDIKTPSGRELTLIHPVYMTRKVLEFGEINNGVLGHITSLKPIRPDNAADPWEREALLAIDKGAKEVSSLEMINGIEYMRLMRPLVTEKECLPCHGKQGYSKDDIRGGISVSVPMEAHWAALGRGLNVLFFGHLFLWLCGVGTIYVGYRLQRRAEKDQNEAEDRLKDASETLSSEYQFKSAVLEGVSEGLCVCHEIPEFPFVRFTVWNKKMSDITGYTMEEINRSGWYQTVYPDPEVRSRAMEKMQRMRLGDDLRHDEWEITRSDGTKRIVSISTSVITIFPDEHHVLALLVDVTQKKKSEAMLFESEKKFRDMAEVSLVGVYLIQDGIFRYCNKKLAEIFGYTSDEIIDKKGPEDLVYPEDWHIVKENLRRRIEGEIDSIHYSFRGITKDRKTIYVDVYGAKTDYLGRNAVLGTLLDITEKKRAEVALLEEHEFITQIIESAQEGIIVYDKDLLIVVCNPYMEQITGLHISELLGRHPENIFPSLHESGVMETLKKALTGETGETCRFQFNIPKTGRSGWVSNINASLRNARGEIIGVIGTMRDITEHMKSEDQLRHSQKMEAIGILTGGIAHDFNNILNVILGYSNIVMDGLEAGSPLKEQMNEVIASADRASHLIKQLLSFSRKQISDIKPVNINDLILNFQKMLVRILRENITLNLNLAESPLIVMADCVQIEQVMMNLATNARDAMSAGGSLTIGTGTQKIDDEYIAVNGYGIPGMYALIMVSDTGHGMDAELQQKIFDPFFTSKGIESGTGLGLSISYGIIKQHNGYIKVYSEPGEGTLFKIYLPLTDEPALIKSKTASADPLRMGNETILVAEDDDSLRDLTRIILESFGYSVITAENGEDAIIKFRENREVISLVILDMIMPKKGGKEAYEEIRMTDPGIRALIMSGYTLETIDTGNIPGSGFDFVHKPVLPKDLLKKVREILDR